MSPDYWESDREERLYGEWKIVYEKKQLNMCLQIHAITRLSEKSARNDYKTTNREGLCKQKNESITPKDLRFLYLK